MRFELLISVLFTGRRLKFFSIVLFCGIMKHFDFPAFNLSMGFGFFFLLSIYVRIRCLVEMKCERNEFVMNNDFFNA